MEYSIGIDIGGTKIAAALVSETGEIEALRTIRTPPEGRTAIISALRETTGDLIREAALSLKQKPVGIGIGSAGQIDFENGRIMSGTPNISDWNDVPLRQLLSGCSGLPVWVDNDVNVMTITEARLGAAKGHKNVICLALGTGVGGGVLADGKLLHGAWGGAGELGHVSVDMFGPLCNCGQRGCLETYASGSGVAARMRDAWAKYEEAPKTPAYREYREKGGRVTSEDVFRWMKEEDSDAASVVVHMLQALSVAIVGYVHTFNPTMIVLGGGLLRDGEWIRAGVAERIGHAGMTSMLRDVSIEMAAFGTESTLIGAAMQVWMYQTNADADSAATGK